MMTVEKYNIWIQQKEPYGYFSHSLMFEHKMIDYVLLFVDCGNLFQIELSMKLLSSICEFYISEASRV